MRGRIGFVVVFGVLASTKGAWAFESGMAEIYRYVGKGDFVVGGVSSRRLDSTNPQAEPFFVRLPAAPAGATLLKAYANWSFMTNNYGPEAARTIKVAGTTIMPGATSISFANLDCNWGRQFGVAFNADITSVVQANGFDFDYTIEGATDNSAYGAIGEGLSILAVFSLPDGPTRDISVYRGYTSTRSGNASGEMTFQEYVGGPTHFFLNGLDGQKDFGGDPMTDDFYLNGWNASVEIGGALRNAWQGKRRFNVLPNTAPNHMYDHAELDVSAFMQLGDTSLRYDTDGFDDFGNYSDCIAHSFGAVAVPVPEPGTLFGLALGIAALSRARRVRKDDRK
ncbi:MAG TPA: PEP-CTERM sorting domain-containing protein [Fimbriimonadaceae bacterium]|nr:PEP-CTERM sorting domain-containing protein [Fimbriimonadaceae bacterium]HRJ96380.1 PEP-CTERM sorting domain-containing protein [Fimbriimonadaceae bacterium]